MQYMEPSSHVRGPFRASFPPFQGCSVGEIQLAKRPLKRMMKGPDLIIVTIATNLFEYFSLESVGQSKKFGFSSSSCDFLNVCSSLWSLSWMKPIENAEACGPKPKCCMWFLFGEPLQKLHQLWPIRFGTFIRGSTSWIKI